MAKLKDTNNSIIIYYIDCNWGCLSVGWGACLYVVVVMDEGLRWTHPQVRMRRMWTRSSSSSSSSIIIIIIIIIISSRVGLKHAAVHLLWLHQSLLLCFFFPPFFLSFLFFHSRDQCSFPPREEGCVSGLIFHQLCLGVGAFLSDWRGNPFAITFG